MLDYLTDSILSMGIYFYLLPIILGFFIFNDIYNSYNYNLKRDKNLSLGGLFIVLVFIIVEYFSKTDVHFVSDIIISLQTGNLQFQKEHFFPLIFLTSIVVTLFWLPSFVAISLSFIVYFSFPKGYIDFGFLIFIIGATFQTIHLIREIKRKNTNEYFNSSHFSYEEYLTLFISFLSVIVKILKIIT